MNDLVFVGMIIAFFGVAAAYVHLCDKAR